MMVSSRHTRPDDPFVIKEGSLKYGNFNGKFAREWVEKSFTPTERGEETISSRLNAKFVAGARWILIFFLVILGSRLCWLQVVNGSYYRDMANGNRLRLERLDASRGIIYDRNGVPLVHNIANFILYCVPADLPKNPDERRALIGRLASLTDRIKPEELTATLNSLKPSQLEYYQPLFIADNIPYDAAIKMYLQSFDMPGIALSSKNRREYQLPSLSFSHLIGYAGKINDKEIVARPGVYSPLDYIGKNGLEKSWEDALRGSAGVKQIEVDALGKEKSVVSETAPIPGSNLILSIDTSAQKKLEELMAVQLQKLNLKKGVAIVMDPRNGEIISMVSLPGFDNNVFARGITQAEYTQLESSPDKPLFHRAVSGEYPSGSTVKPVIAAGALQEGIISSETTFLSSGGIRVGQWSFPDWKGGGHGVTDVRKAIAESVNTFFYIIGGGYGDFTGLGIDRMVDYLTRFRLGSALGIDLPNEADGFVPTKAWKEETKNEAWYIGDTYHVAIGQGDLITTPIQVAEYTSYFANGGTFYKPHLVKQLTDADGKVVRDINPEVLSKDVVRPDVTKIVREGMRQTATTGSARSLSALPVQAAGKTGTAQWSTKKAPHAWFTGFAPYDNAEIVVTILIEEGKEGSSAATPVAREFMQWYFTRTTASPVAQP
jgi:penicillin-binding protein 2